MRVMSSRVVRPTYMTLSKKYKNKTEQKEHRGLEIASKETEDF
jgi:hypothetical protein